MSKKIGLVVLLFCLVICGGIQSVFAQGGTVSGVHVDHPADKPCATLVYFDLDGFMPQTTLYAQSLGYTEVSCETGQQNSGSWPKGTIGVTDSNGHYTHGSYIGGVSGNYSLLFTDNVTSVTFTYQTNERGDIVSSSYQKSGQPQAPQVNPTSVPENPPVNPVQSGAQYPQGHDGVEWGGIHFGNYCGAFGQSEYNDGAHGKSWGCGGQTLDHNTICRNIYGDALPFAEYKGEGLGDVYCGTTPSTGNAGWAAPPDVLPTVSDKWCAVQAFDTTPSSDHFDPGTQVSLFGRGGNCQYGNNGLPRATRFSIDGKLYGEKQQSENYDTWDTSKYSQGTHTVCFMVASDRDTTWEHRDEQCRTYTIGQVSQPAQPDKPNPPVVSNDCPEALPALVQAGTIAIVNTLSSDNLNVRSSPHVAKETKIDQLAPRSTFTIVDGPVCSEGYRWWQIGYNGKTGYAAEAGARAYNFVPNGTTLPYDPTGTIQNPAPIVTQPDLPANPADPMPLSYTEMYEAPFTSCNSSGVTIQNASVLLVDTGFSNSNADCDATVGGLITNGFSWGGVETDPNASSAPIQMTPWAEIIQKYTADENGLVRIDVAIDVNGYARAVATAKEVIPFGILDNLKKLGGGIYGLVTSENVIAELINKTNEFGDSLSKTQVWSKGDFSFQAYVWTNGGEQRLELTGTPLYYVFPYTYGKTTNALYWNAPQSVVLLSITVPVSAGQTLDVHTGLSLVAHSYGPVGTYISQDKSYVQAIVFTKVK